MTALLPDHSSKKSDLFRKYWNGRSIQPGNLMNNSNIRLYERNNNFFKKATAIHILVLSLLMMALAVFATVDAHAAKLQQNLEIKPQYQLTPVGGTNWLKVKHARGELVFRSLTPNIASVNQHGKVTALRKGKAVIQVISRHTEKYDYTARYVKLKVISDEFSDRNETVVLSKNKYKYNGKKHRPRVTVISKRYNKKMEPNVDYSVRYKNNKMPGKARVIIEGLHGFDGTIEQEFIIQRLKKPITVSAWRSTINVNDTTSAIVKKVKKRNIVYKSSDTSVATVDSKGNIKGIKAGTAKITVTAEQNEIYEKSEKSFTIRVVEPTTATTSTSTTTTTTTTTK